MLSEIPISSITIGDRFRKDLGDLTELAESIDAIGLLHPIGITHSRELVYGLRRLRATELNGGDTITARVVYLDDPLRAERDENGCRKDFAPSELVAIGRAIEEKEKKAAEERQKATRAKPGQAADKRPEKVSTPENKPETGRAKDKAAAAVGVSRPTYEKAKAVVEAAEADPVFRPVVEEMDRTGNVNGAFKVVQAVQAKAATEELNRSLPEELRQSPEKTAKTQLR